MAPNKQITKIPPSILSTKRGFIINVATATSLERTGFYAANELFVTQTTDENQNISYMFTDKLGRTVLTRVMEGSEQNDTYCVYDAAEQKLSVTYLTAVARVTTPTQVYSTFKTDYCGSVVYENGAVSRILTEEGYITLSGSTPTYHYYLKDHQGNNRVVLNQNGTVEQVSHYYPFGGLFGESTAGGVQPYKYNGKELDRMHGLDLFDYGARHYDAAVGRWWGVDALAEWRIIR